MPSFGEMRIVSGVTVTTGEDVDVGEGIAFSVAGALVSGTASVITDAGVGVA